VRKFLTCIFTICVLSHSANAQENNERFDLLILNGRIIDGTGNPWVYSDVGIIGDRIASVGRLTDQSASRVIDAQGMVVTPGFIDVHTHSDKTLADSEASANLQYLLQGVTTVRPGADGLTNHDPLNTKRQWEGHGIGTNAVLTVGYNVLRRDVMQGDVHRSLTNSELQEMQVQVRAAMEEGAWGVSAGMEEDGAVADGVDIYATPEEIIEVFRPAAEMGGFFMAHMRDEADNVLASVEEMIQVGEATSAPVNVTHIKVTGDSNWGLMPTVISLIESARNRGVQITADQYPWLQGMPIDFITDLVDVPPQMETLYTLSQESRRLNDPANAKISDPAHRKRFTTELQQALSDKTQRNQLRNWTYKLKQDEMSPVARWGWGDFRIMVADKNVGHVGKGLAELAEEQGRDGFDVLADLILDEPDILFASASQSPQDMRHALVQDWVMISSDGTSHPHIDSNAEPVRDHPRSFASNAVVLRRFVREEKLITLVDAVRKMTSLPAQFLGMKDRGILREGFAADLVIFDPDRVRDEATYSDAYKLATGISFVIVNGQLSVEDGIFNGNRGGKVLLKTYR
jgi:N-acyl-D-amino-acid deacylase